MILCFRRVFEAETDRSSIGIGKRDNGFEYAL